MAIIHDGYLSAVHTSSADDIKTKEYINSIKATSYDAYISDENSWQVFCNLTDIAAGMISWYPFETDCDGKGSSLVLCVGAGFGTIAGRLCSKCRHVVATERLKLRVEAMADRNNADNLDIFCGDIMDDAVFEDVRITGMLYNPSGYDYIILPGLLSLQTGDKPDVNVYVSYLKKLSKLLNSSGKLLIGEDNRMGLKYWCGAPDYMTGRAFDSLNGYPNGSKGYEFTRAELLKVIEMSGLRKKQVYYPLPDFRLPQMVFSDEYMPGSNVRERLIPYYMRNDSLIIHELGMYADVIDNGAFKAMANSFIVECQVMGECEDAEDSVVYATLSADRGLSGSFATCVKKNEAGYYVEKMPLYDEGRESARRICDNIEYLRSHNLSVVPHTLLDNGTIRMPYMELSTLSAYIKELVSAGDAGKIYELLDRVYENILKSSEESDVLNEAFAKYDLEPKEWGPVIKKAYLELIPLNIFFDDNSEEFIYFDQEFEMDDSPAGFVMYRAICYAYSFIPEMESLIHKDELIDRYGMAKTWEFYVNEENDFQKRVRLIDQYKLFFGHTYVDGGKLKRNADMLNASK